MRPPQIHFIISPFTSVDYPNLETGIASAAARAAGFQVKTINLNQVFSSIIGEDAYKAISSTQRATGVGEWVGGTELRRLKVFPACVTALRDHATFSEYLQQSDEYIGPHQSLLDDVSEYIPLFIEKVAADSAWSNEGIYLFVCKHHQLAFNLSIASRLYTKNPSLRLFLFGPLVAARETAVALVDCFEAIEGVILGSAADLLLNSPSSIIDRLVSPAVVWNARTPVKTNNFIAINRGSYINLRPDFEVFYKNNRIDSGQCILPWRMSAGCKWGDRSHCTFCGLIEEGETSLEKKSEHAFTELTDLLSQHQILDVITADLLFDPIHYSKFLESLAESDYDCTLFLEVRATLSKAELLKMVTAGVTHLQIGIESFDSRALKAMGKGTTALVNIRALKWCAEMNICASWIYLFGFPEEDKESISNQLKLIKNCTHLQPPIACTQVRIERGSPMFKSPEHYGFTNIKPSAFWLHSFPLPLSALKKICIDFDHDFLDGRDISALGKPLRDAVTAWRENWALDDLYYRVGPGFVKIFDFRPPQKITTLTLWRADLFVYLDEIRHERTIIQYCASRSQVNELAIEEFLKELQDLSLVVVQNKKWLSVVPRENRAYQGRSLIQRRKEAYSKLG